MDTKTIPLRSVTALLTGILLVALTAQSSVAEPPPLPEGKTFKKGTDSITWIVPAGYTNVNLTATCGETRGKDRVPSALVMVNGTVLMKPRHFNQNVEELTRSIDDLLGDSRQLLVEVSVVGSHDATLHLKLIADYHTQQPTQQTGPQTLPGTTSSPTQSVMWYRDMDFDGFGIGSPMPYPAGVTPTASPTSPYQWVTVGGDCNDSRADVYPGNGC